MRKRDPKERSLPDKANRILNGILIVLLLFAARIWHLSIIQHDEMVEASKRPQRRTVIQKAERAPIYDRFGLPLALNEIQYNAAILFAPIRDVPRYIWEKDESGKRIKRPRRKEYIEELSALLGELLHLDAERVEDLIYSKAAIFSHTPCVLKENISEEIYFRLKMLEKDWPGLAASPAARRVYPQKQVGAEVVGYLGPISRSEYDRVFQEMQHLRKTLQAVEEGQIPGDVATLEKRLGELESKGYRINDLTGKIGVEATFDESLRGAQGKKVYLADTRGNILKELPGAIAPEPGTPLRLSISAELQAFAEELLRNYEKEPLSLRPQDVKRRSHIPEHQPWIKGGAIVALVPKTGEVIALASSPSFDPNDFIRSGHADEDRAKAERVNRWLETDQHVASIWNFRMPLEKEGKKLRMDWENYLDCILPRNAPIRAVLDRREKVADALFVQGKMEALLTLFDAEECSLSARVLIDLLYDGEHVPTGALISLQAQQFFAKKMDEVFDEVFEIQQALAPYFNELLLNYEKLLLVDLYRLAAPTKECLFGQQSLQDYRHFTGHISVMDQTIREMSAEIFHSTFFKNWRESEFKTYLAGKRKEEIAAKKKYQRPYIEYLDLAEKEQFAEFWGCYREELIALFLTGQTDLSDHALAPFINCFRTWNRELLAGAHPALPWRGSFMELATLYGHYPSKILCAAIATCHPFDDLIFPLYGYYAGLRREGGVQLGKHLASAFYPRYGFGFARSYAFRQAGVIGSIYKLVPAYEGLRQNYFALLEQGLSTTHLNPLELIDDKHRLWSGKGKGGWNVGYHLDGRPIPMYYKGGRVPRSEHAGVGRVDLPRALETSSNPYFSLLASDVIDDPDDLVRASILLGYGEKTGIDLTGEYAGKVPQDVTYDRTGLYALAIGQHSLVGTPLQTATMLSCLANGGYLYKPQVKLGEPEERWQVFCPKEIQRPLLQGMQQVVQGPKGTARFLKQTFPKHAVAHLVGKTSTAEAVEWLSLDGTYSRLKSKHIGFGGIFFADEELEDPELVVVVYLRFGQWGRLAAPLTVKIAEKWKSLLEKHSLVD